MKNFVTVLVAASVGAAMFFAGRGCARTGGEDEGSGSVRTDTLVVYDTVRAAVPPPVAHSVVRTDTLWLRPAEAHSISGPVHAARTEVGVVGRIPDGIFPAGAFSFGGAGSNLPSGDGAVGDVPQPFLLPVERKVYATADYRAVVEGVRPALVEMELLRRTAVVTRRTPADDAKRWGVEVQAGWGFSPKGAVPYVGVGVGYRVVAW